MLTNSEVQAGSFNPAAAGYPEFRYTSLTNPTLYIINNPSENLKVQEKIEVVRFVVPLEEWKDKGVKA